MALCVIPAAGSSTRMGTPKALLPWRGSTVVEALVDTFRAGGVERIRVVVGPNGEQIRARLASLANVRISINPDPRRGMLSSVLTGIEAARAEAPIDGPTLVCPVDHPLLEAGTVGRLLAVSEERPRSILVPGYDGRRGHPLLIPAPLVDSLAGLDPSRGLRALLDRHRDEVVEIPVTDAGVVTNLNTPRDYELARRVHDG